MDLTTVEVAPKNKPVAGIIWLHGLGADGHDFEQIVPELRLPPSLPIHFIFPNAPRQKVTLNRGIEMPSWYNIYAISNERDFSLPDLVNSTQSIHQLIHKLINSGIPSNKILLAGFSQGGAVAIEAALTFAQPLAGLMCLSTYFASEKSIARNSANQTLSIAVYHGSMDPVVPEHLGKKLVSSLQHFSYPVEYHSYAMAHGVCPQQIYDISVFIQQRLQ